MPDPIKAVTAVVSTPVAAFKKNPVVWFVALAVVAVLVIRYRDVIVSWFNRAPIVGGRVVAFTNR
jgi:hypothetical protein